MPEAVAEPPVAPQQRTMPSPQSAIASFLKVESDIAPAEPPAPPPATPPPPQADKPVRPPEKPVPVTADNKAEPEKPPTNAQKWKEFTQARDAAIKEREDKIATLQSEMKKLSEQAAALPKDDPEKEQLRKERKELSDQLFAIGRERHPDFVNKYDKQIEAKVGLIQKIVGGENGKKVARILKLPELDESGEQLAKLTEELNDIQKSRIASLLNDVLQLQESRSSELNVSKGDFDRMVAEHNRKQKDEQDKAQRQQHAMIDQMFDQSLAKFRDKDKGMAELSEKDGDDAWNNSLKKGLADAKAILRGEADPDKVVSAVLTSVALPAVKQERDSLREEVVKLTGQLKAYQDASPGLRQGSAQPGGTPPGMPPKNSVSTTPQEAMKRWLSMPDADTA